MLLSFLATRPLMCNTTRLPSLYHLLIVMRHVLTETEVLGKTLSQFESLETRDPDALYSDCATQAKTVLSSQNMIESGLFVEGAKSAHNFVMLHKMFTLLTTRGRWDESSLGEKCPSLKQIFRDIYVDKPEAQSEDVQSEVVDEPPASSLNPTIEDVEDEGEPEEANVHADEQEPNSAESDERPNPQAVTSDEATDEQGVRATDLDTQGARVDQEEAPHSEGSDFVNPSMRPRTATFSSQSSVVLVGEESTEEWEDDFVKV
jgi:hypothetical protein